MDEVKKSAAALGVPLESSAKYQELTTRLNQLGDLTTLENEVYSDLYTFFRRYYKNGDFLSLRRYKPGVYAVPYEGEEIKLHWANADQYYVKTAENFRNYRFKLESVGYVNFELVATMTEWDNEVATGMERRFVLRAEASVEERDEELHIYFECRPHPDKQKDLNTRALTTIFENVSGAWKTGLAEPKPTQSNKDRTLLEKRLNEYTARNTFDYFIHKNLGAFLRRELDFFLKSEVLHIDDLDTENERRVGQYLSRLKVIKRIGHKIIAFLAHIEDFQRMLFLKAKFVVRSDYCLTLDHVPKDLYEEIVANDEQYKEWERLFTISEISPTLENSSAGGDQRTVEWLEDNPYLVLDTKFFDQNFKDRLLASIEDLDEKTGGVLINSENFQALNLLRARYRERVKCIYIDPPYNTAATEILYKNNYKHSSWLALMENRLRAARPFLQGEGILCVTIDDVEFHRLYSLLLTLFGDEEAILGTAVIRSNPSGRSTVHGFSVAHEYAVFVANDRDASIGRLQRTEEQLARYDEFDEKGRFEWVNFRKHGGADANRRARPRLFYPIYASKNGAIRIPCMEWRESEKKWIVLEEPLPSEKPVYPVNIRGDEKRWKWGHERVSRDLSELRARPDQAKKTGIYMKARMREEGTLPSTWWDKREYSATEYGTNFLSDILGDVTTFSFPKSINATEDSLRVSSLEETDICLDFFAGSGTTGQAVINLNREDEGSRQYVLVEMGEYFDKALKRRIQRVIYSRDWEEGKPVSREGTSHIFKYITLESYEDTLNNLSLRRTKIQDYLIEQDAALREEYMLSYMLDFETKESSSLLNLDTFQDPFSYKLNITRDDETHPENVDLVETFNYLLGLTVSRTYTSDGYRVVEGTNLAGERALVIWRNTRENSNDDLDAFFEGQDYAGAGFDHVYVNGDNTLALKSEGEDWKVHLIEEEFRRLMFEVGVG
jgi:adenine-specific DNA-methyltransferase